MPTCSSWLVVYHPSYQKKLLDQLEKCLQQAAIGYSCLATSGDFARDLKRLKACSNGLTRVVVLGGDGTLHLVVNAFAYTAVEVALIPCGSGNDFARQWRVSQAHWLATALRAPAQRIDLGRINDRYFVNVAGVGYDAEVVRATQNKKGRLARWRYSWEGLRHLYTYSNPQVRVEIDGKVTNQRQLMCCFANGQFFGGGMKVAPDANVTSGALNYLSVAQGAPLRQAVALLFSYFGAHTRLAQITTAVIKRCEVTTVGLGIEADGEYLGTTPAVISCQADALLFVVPR